MPRGPRVLHDQGGDSDRITGPGPGERELPLLRLLFSIVHDYDTGPCRGGCERDRMSHTEPEVRLHWRRTSSPGTFLSLKQKADIGRCYFASSLSFRC